MAESESLVVVSVADGVGRLRLNRADKRKDVRNTAAPIVTEAHGGGTGPLVPPVRADGHDLRPLLVGGSGRTVDP